MGGEQAIMQYLKDLLAKINGKLSNYRTYISLWVPVVLALMALIGVEVSPSLLDWLKTNGFEVVTGGPMNWLVWAGMLCWAMSGTFQRLGTAKAQKEAHIAKGAAVEAANASHGAKQAANDAADAVLDKQYPGGAG